MVKAHENQNWENYPSVKTPLNEKNLNKLDKSVDVLDDRIITHEEVKANKSDIAELISGVKFNEKTGVFTFTRKNGVEFTIDTLLETILTNWSYDKDTQRLILTMESGDTQYVDLSALITEYEFDDTETISFTVDSTGKVSAKVIEGSIGEKHLRPDYLADVKLEVAKAEQARDAAQEAEAKAEQSKAEVAESAKESADSAAASAASAAAALESQNAAKDSETASENAMNAAKASETNAENSAAAAKDSETNAENSATSADSSATAAAKSAEGIAESEKRASEYATKAQSYAVGGTETRESEETDNAKYYYEQAKESADKAAEIAGGNYIPKTEKGAIDGVATLGADGKVPNTQLPDDIGKVKSVNGKTGAVVITAEDVGALGKNDTAVSAKKVENPLTFTGAVTGTYNGSSAREFNIPTSLPANGGNADTVGGKHASDFVSKSGDTMNGRLYVNGANVTGTGFDDSYTDSFVGGNLDVGSRLSFYTNGGGGNIRITSPSGKHSYEFDAYNGDLRIWQLDRKAQVFTLNKTDGSITASKFKGPLEGKATSAGTADKVAHTLTFTGAASGTFDGSSDKTINIPSSSSSSGGNADTVDGYHVSPGGSSIWGRIPVVHTDGVMEVGKIIDFHLSSGGSSDYDARITASSSGLSVSNTLSATNLTGQTGDSTVTFSSSDLSDGSVTKNTGWTTVTALATGIKHNEFFKRVSQMFKNIRYLYKLLGTADISSIGDGTVRGAISTLNSKKLSIDGSTAKVNPVTNLNLFYNGIGLFNTDTIYNPAGEWILVIAAGVSGTCAQRAYKLFDDGNVWYRHCAAGSWGSWTVRKYI